MKLSFLILAHKNPAQLQLLVDYLLKHDCTVFLHIDAKSRRSFDDFVSKNRDAKNLFIYSKYKVYWGSYTQIETTLFLLEECVKHSEFDFVSLISGQDLFLKSLPVFQKYLSEHRENSFLEYARIPEEIGWGGNGGLDRTELYWLMNYHPKLGFLYNRNKVAAIWL